MTDRDRFKVMQVLEQVEVILESKPNSSSFEFFINLKEELTEKLNKE
tara:strand:+ start:41 stop:181 length:141 start_codon:yes stop_codon:yes gene_type:complete